MDWTLVPFNASWAVNLQGNATGTFKVEFTLDDVNGSITPTWFTDANAPANTTTSVSGNYISPVRSLRLNCSALSSGGSINFVVLQGLPV